MRPTTLLAHIILSTTALGLSACSYDSNPSGVVESDIVSADETAAERDADPRPSGTIHAFAVGREWTYAVQPVQPAASRPWPCTEMTKRITRKKRAGGRLVFVVESVCGSETREQRIGARGDRAEEFLPDNPYWGSRSRKPWLLVLDAPVQEAHAWYNGLIDDVRLEWHSLGAVTVPAGTFHDCWELRSVLNAPRRSRDGETMAADEYCRGVGLVRGRARELNGFSVGAMRTEIELSAKNF